LYPEWSGLDDQCNQYVILYCSAVFFSEHWLDGPKKIYRSVVVLMDDRELSSDTARAKDTPQGGKKDRILYTPNKVRVRKGVLPVACLLLRD
jgi:hypothetical protein